MRLRVTHVVRFSTAAAVMALPVALGSFAPAITSAEARQPRAAATTEVSTAPLAVDLPETSTPAPQQTEPVTTIEGRLVLDKHQKVRVDSPKGSRVWTASALADHGLPAAALRAYRTAAATMGRLDAGCQLPWTLLAGIGRVESDHGRYGGSVLASDGVSRPAILGLPLNGVGPVAAIADSDNGRFDGDKMWDRAVGPMQFIPSTWRYAGRDGDGDGAKNPNDIDDAALAAAGYLCSGSGSVLPDAAMRAAIFRYNPSDYYVSLVMAFERGYRTGVFALPSPPAPSGGDHAPRAHHHADKRPNHPRHAEHQAQHTKTKQQSKQVSSKPAPKPASKPSSGGTSSGGASSGGASSGGASSGGTTSTPKSTTSPTTSSTSPSPAPTLDLVQKSGVLATCAAGWCLDGVALDLGPDSQLNATAAADFDGDGVTTESNADELTGLAAQGSVTISVKKDTMVVYVLAGKDYRYADGTFAH